MDFLKNVKKKQVCLIKQGHVINDNENGTENEKYITHT